MSRYADVEKLLEAIRCRLGVKTLDYVTQQERVIIEEINNAPTIDIVRCGECKYWKSTVQMPNGTEVKCLYGRKADDFCSYGERKSDE